MKYLKKVTKQLDTKQIQIIGSYSSFYGLLLIATLIFYRNLFETTVSMLQRNVPETHVIIYFYIILTIFILMFFIFPNIVIIVNIINAYKHHKGKFVWLLIYITLIYNLTAIVQFIYAYQEQSGKII